jgi:hypothetical protein
MVLAASRSFTGRSPTLDPPKGKPDDRVPSLSPSVPGAGADSKEKRLVEMRLRIRQKLLKNGTPEMLFKPGKSFVAKAVPDRGLLPGP